MIRGLVAAISLAACHGDVLPPWVGPSGLTAVVADQPGDWMVTEHRFQISASAPLNGELVCTSPADPLEDHHVPVVGASADLRLQGLLAATPYDCALRIGSTALWSGSFVTDPLPSGFPVLVPSGDPDRASSDDGYVLFNHWKLGSEYVEIQRLVIADGAGNVRWYLPMQDATTGGVAASLLPDGLVVAGGGQGSPPSLYTLGGEVVFQVPPAIEADPGYSHEALLTPEGWVLSLQGVNNVGAEGSWLGFLIEATDPATREVRWSFASQPWVTAGVLPPPTNPDDLDPYHANAVSWVPDDPEGASVWVSLRGLGQLMRIDRATGEIAGFFGPNQGIKLIEADGSAAIDQEWFWGQHAPEYRGDQILVYDNGGKRPGPQQVSRVALYRRLDAADAQLLWQWTEPHWYEPNFGSVVTLPDGHVLIGTGHCADCDPKGDTAWIAEVDPGTDDVVWRVDFSRDDDAIYRAEPVDGCAVFANRRFCPASPDPVSSEVRAKGRGAP